MSNESTSSKQQATDMWSSIDSGVKAASEKYSKPEGLTYAYGTAGFRMNASKLPSVVFRTALLAVLRSKQLSGATIGVMITASHNPAADNGVKIVDPTGEMLEQSWEIHATALANSPTSDSLAADLQRLAKQLNVPIDGPASVVFARDTRPSGIELTEALKAGLGAFGDSVKFVDVGITTTPVLHHVVAATNDKTGLAGEPTVEGYLSKLSKAFETAISGKGPLQKLYVDCANGVGINTVSAFSKLFGSDLPLEAVNTDIDNPAVLNLDCGADFVKTRQALPPSVQSAGYLTKADTRGCSFDGDADRIVYYYLKGGKDFRLLDGDKIAVLVTMFLVDLVERAKSQLKVGVVQTAYANGSSTRHLASRGIEVTCVPTGVKHLHAAAHHYDIGVYFEANGHGTVLFSENCIKTLQSASASDTDAGNAVSTLLAFSQLINQSVGDALSDMLMVEAVLAQKKWGAAEWDEAYEDLPNKLLKVEVADRNIFVAEDAERKLASPEGLQKKIDAEIAKVQSGRSFVRPSGTEDCVRVYAEASTPEETESLANSVAALVRQASGQ